ncbi:MAG: hypothetical protein ABI876_03035 [Bacteroidota bacterium]
MKKRLLTLAAAALAASGITASAQSFADYEIALSSMGSAINGPGNDYAPTITPDRSTFYFTSYARSGAAGEADEFIARRSGNGWGAPKGVGASMNTTKNDGGLAIASDGRTVVFAAERPDGLGDVDLYIGELHDGEIANARNLGPAVNSAKWDSHPTISGDGSTIYFASNRPGGSGKTDIWMTSKDPNGGWSQAANLGPNVNSGRDERSPYITPDGGTLYFSSKGHDGYGGYDVFVSVRDSNAWSTPLNLGATINSPADELFFQAPVEGDQFFLSSSRADGYGKLDIYSGTPNIYGAGMVRLHVSVVDSTTGKPLPGTITITDMATGRAVKSISTSALTAENMIPLPAGRKYRIEGQVRDTSKSVVLAETPANGEKSVRLMFGRLVIKLVDFGKYDIPFFVTGYYRPNTSRNLEELFALRDGPLRKADYIEEFTRGSKKYQDYDAYSKTVESLFNTLVRSCVDDIFPDFRRRGLPTEVIEIRVSGFADPTPISGKYVEDTPITYQDASGTPHTINNGDKMDNDKLSGLRAYYSAQLLDSMMTAESAKAGNDYGILKNEGRIIFRYIGGGVSADKDDYAAKRRIVVELDRRAREEGE